MKRKHDISGAYSKIVGEIAVIIRRSRYPLASELVSLFPGFAESFQQADIRG